MDEQPGTEQQIRVNKEILENLCGWGRELKVNLKDDLLLAKGYNGLTSWDNAVKNGKKEILETLSGWGREVEVNLKMTCYYHRFSWTNCLGQSSK